MILNENIALILIIILIPVKVLFLGPFIFYRAYKEDMKRIAAFFKKDKNRMTEEKLLLEMATSYENSGNNEKALEYLFMYLKKVPQDASIYYRISHLLSYEHPESAIQYLEKAADLGYKEAIEKLNALKGVQGAR